MIDLRRLAVGLIAIGLVVSAVYGTGAFDSLTTSRDATVQVVGDASGYLALAPADGPNGAYASQRNGQLQVSLAGAFEDTSGSGVNPDAITGVREVFTITNRGTQPVGVWVTDESERVTFEAGNGPIEKREWAMTLQPGESRHIDLVVDTRGYTGDDVSLLESVTIHADAEAAGQSDGDGDSGQSSDGDTVPEPNPNPEREPESDDSAADPPTTAGPPELSPEMKDRMEEVRSEQDETIDDTEDSSNSGDDVVGTIAGIIGSTVGVNEGTVAKHGGTTVLKSGARVLSRVAVPLTAAYVFFEHGVDTAGGPSTTHGSLTMLALYPADATDSELNEPIRLPSGAGGYDAPDGTSREFGRDQLVQLPGITHDNVRGTVGEILKDPEEVREEDGYTVVVGENPQGDGEITLWIYDGFVMKGTTEEMEQSEEAEQEQPDHDGDETQQQDDGSSDSSGPSPRRLLPEIARLIPDGGEDQVTQIKSEADDDITYHNWDKWRQSLEKATDEDDVSEEDVQRYLDDVETISKRDDVQGYTSLIKEVSDNPDKQFHDVANEADRAVYYSDQGRDVTVEPGTDDNIDLKTVDSNTGETEYIELKRVTATLDFHKSNEYLFEENGADDKFSDASVDTSDGKKILEIRLPNTQDSTAEEAEAGVKSAIRTRKLDKSVLTDEVRVFLDDEEEPTVIIKTEDVNINGQYT